MKRSLLLITMLILTRVFGLAQGVMVVDAPTGACFQLIQADVHVAINNQVAIFTSTAWFRNNFNADTAATFIFPMPDDGNAISLRWYQDSVWHDAVFSSNDQDTTLPGTGGPNPSANLQLYMGQTPLYFQFDNKVKHDSIIIVELTYVQLLPYAMSYVNLSFPAQYNIIQSLPVTSFEYQIDLTSARSIDEFTVLNPTGASVIINDTLAGASVTKTNFVSSANMEARYKLAPAETGLYSFSTFLPDSAIVCDTFGRGYFAFIVEPNPSDTVVINKDFIIIIDHSGSMSGTKIEQAKDAAEMIINNLNPGDRFNIVKFETSATAFQSGLVPFNTTNQISAINYINQIAPAGTTCISCGFQLAIPQFVTSDPDAAKIILFFTDGQANVGTSDNAGILSLVNNLANSYAPDLDIHTFGIGSGVNTQLLSQLAMQHNGFCNFLSDTNLFQVMTNFYYTIQNPVLLNTTMSFNPPVIYETYPLPLPNLYGGFQLLVVGRYDTPGTVQVTFNGTAFGNSVTYTYDFLLADTIVPEYFFLPKIWAKKKIEHMMTEYYTYPSNSSAALNLEKEIKELSVCNGVMSIFTSFVDDSPYSEIEETSGDAATAITSWPNPFSDKVWFDVSGYFGIDEGLILEIYSMDGKLIYRSASGAFSGADLLVWKGCDLAGNPVKAGSYVFRIVSDQRYITGTIIKQ